MTDVVVTDSERMQEKILVLTRSHGDRRSFVSLGDVPVYWFVFFINTLVSTHWLPDRTVTLTSSPVHYSITPPPDAVT